MLAAPAPAALSPTKVLFADSFADDDGRRFPRGAALHGISASWAAQEQQRRVVEAGGDADASTSPSGGL